MESNYAKLIVVISLMANLCSVPTLYAGKYVTYTNVAKYKIRHSASSTNHDITTLTSLELNLPVPTKWPELLVSGVKTKGESVFEVNNIEGPGKLVRCFFDSNLPSSGEKKSLELSYRIFVKEIKAKKHLLEKITYPDYVIDDQYKYYTRSEKMIESDDAEIISIAKKIKKQTQNPYQFAKATYNYVIDNISYEMPSTTWTAKECLSKRKGECGQYSALFVAICRAGGIPARPVAGAWCQGDNSWHCWAEFNLPGVGWIPADPTIGQQSADKKKYYFGNLDNNHLPLMKCFNSKFASPRGSKKAGFVQIGSWFWFYSGGSKGKSISADFSMHGERVGNRSKK